MGFDLDAITLDLEDRPRKMLAASAWPVRIPDDVRVCIKPVGGVADLAAVYHEMGHALHFGSIDPDLPYARRAGYTCSVAETFSYWLERLLSDPIYLRELGLGKRAAAELIRFRHLVTATASTLPTAESLCVMDDWVEGPFTLEELGERFSRYVKQLMGLSVPAHAIRVLPPFARTLDLTVVGYPLAYARLGHLLNQLEATQRDWWRSSHGIDIVRGYMRGGRKAGFPSSMLDVGPFVRRYAVGPP
jgi:hypothetical protein